MVKRATGASVNVRQIFANDCTQTHNVEMRIAELERVKCPFDHVMAARQSVISLRKLQLSADAAILVLRQHRSHVGMNVTFSVSLRHESEDEADSTFPVKRPNHLASSTERHYKHAVRHCLQIGESPNPSLQIDADLHFFVG